MASNGWQKVYEDENVKINVGPNGAVGIWHGTTGGWRATHVSSEDKVYQGNGSTMEVARTVISMKRHNGQPMN